MPRSIARWRAPVAGAASEASLQRTRYYLPRELDGFEGLGEILEGLIRDPETNPAAKCRAIRTLLRVTGQDELDEGLERLLRD